MVSDFYFFRKRNLRVLSLLLLMACTNQLVAQCITSYPYFEGFETAPSWTTSGTASSWAWGTPRKNIINSAGTGLKCWITGGLTGRAYNDNESSNLVSPCFDFTNVAYPLLSFKYFCATEQRYDGARVEYSIDGGSSWTTLGGYNEDACQSYQWYNTAALYQQGPGWSGNTNGWIVGKHAMPALAGKSNVRIRFHFSAGYQQNNYNGFAVDDITISDVQPHQADFIYSCSNNTTVQFINNTSLCASFLWNFDDPSSSDNTSTTANPTHTFASVGAHNIKLKATFSDNNAVVEINKTVYILSAETKILSNITCNGLSDGSATVSQVYGNAPSYSFLWSNGATTQQIDNLTVGTYSVTINTDNGCGASNAVVITQPEKLGVSILSNTNEKCNNSKGAVEVRATGGTPDYTYVWSNGTQGRSIENLKAQTLQLSVTDANSCKADTVISIQNIDNNISINLGKDTGFCPGNSLILTPGNFASYLWQDNSTQSTYKVTKTGNYAVKVTDSDGCTASSAITVLVDCSEVYFPSAFSPNNDNTNDRFGPLGNTLLMKDYQLTIYNRWGQKVFLSNAPETQWDGRWGNSLAEIGTYVWIADYNYNGKKRTQKGTLTLIR